MLNCRVRLERIMEGGGEREAELAEVLRGVAGGVAMKCINDNSANKNNKVINYFVNNDLSIAGARHVS